MTGAFKWLSPLRHFLKCLLNLSLREQPPLPALDMLNLGWVGERLARCAAAEILPKMTHDPTYSS